MEATDESAIFERAIWDRLPLTKWSSPGGHVVLLGDAAHAMHPGKPFTTEMHFPVTYFNLGVAHKLVTSSVYAQSRLTLLNRQNYDCLHLKGSRDERSEP